MSTVEKALAWRAHAAPGARPGNRIGCLSAVPSVSRLADMRDFNTAHHGVTVEAARAVIDWGFRKRGLAKVYAYADARNVQSLRVMEKLGMTREGTLRSHRKFRDERVDDVYYGLLREESEPGRG